VASLALKFDAAFQLDETNALEPLLPPRLEGRGQSAPTALSEEHEDVRGRAPSMARPVHEGMMCSRFSRSNRSKNASGVLW
jgi:hypothetical protein